MSTPQEIYDTTDTEIAELTEEIVKSAQAYRNQDDSTDLDDLVFECQRTIFTLTIRAEQRKEAREGAHWLSGPKNMLFLRSELKEASNALGALIKHIERVSGKEQQLPLVHSVLDSLLNSIKKNQNPLQRLRLSTGYWSKSKVLPEGKQHNLEHQINMVIPALKAMHKPDSQTR